ncbi:MAG: hypothetical protein ACM3ME_01455, partial [Chloroflexota bacterium]
MPDIFRLAVYSYKISVTILFFLLFSFKLDAQNDKTVLKVKDSLTKVDGSKKLVYQFDIMDEIAPPVWRLTKKAL